MKTTRDILEILDSMDVKLHAMRVKPQAYERKEAARWHVSIEAERDGVEVKVGMQRGATFDEALGKAWAKFEPAASGGLPQLAIADASFEVVKGADDEEMPF